MTNQKEEKICECKKCGQEFCIPKSFVGSIICESCDPFMSSTPKQESWKEKMMDEFCVTFERAQDEMVFERFESFIEKVLLAEREKMVERVEKLKGLHDPACLHTEYTGYCDCGSYCKDNILEKVITIISSPKDQPLAE